MTRENKVALVVGFALVLFVGVLISDHLSKAQSQQSASLIQAGAPPAPAGSRPVELVDLRPAPPRGAGALPGRARPARKTGTASMQPPDRPEPPVPVPPRTEAPPAERFHDVQPGESLSVISVRYYGDVSLTGGLARFNGLDDPDHVRAGRRLRVPPASVLRGRTAGGQPPAPPATTANAPAAATAGLPAPPASQAGPWRTYTVQPGDCLSDLARRFLDSAARWRSLWDFNRDVIRDPDRLDAGTVIRVPS